MIKLDSILAGAALMLGALDAAAGPQRSYVAGNFFFQLENDKPGHVRSVEGGAISAPVIQTQTQGGSVDKHIGRPKVEEFNMQMGFSEPKALLDWISDFVDANQTRKNGAIIAADFNYTEQSRREFTDALLTEVTIPACDGASKDPAYMTVKFSPESVQRKTGGGVKGSFKIDAKKQKQWLPSNFRLSLPGVDTTKVTKIESLTIKQSVSDSETGETRDPIRVPGRIEYPNLRFTLPEASARDFIVWHEDFVINGNNSEKPEGSLSLLSADGKEEIAKVTFFNLGIFRLEHSSSAHEPANVMVDLYVERMQIDFMAQFEK